MNPSLLSSKKMDYCTPQDFFNKLDQEFHFTLDAAATPKSAKCQRYYTPVENGLEMPWSCGGGGSILKSPKRPGDWKLVPQSVGAYPKIKNHAPAHPSQNRYGVFPRLHIRLGRNPLCTGAATVYGRGGQGIPGGPISIHGSHLQQKEQTA